VRDRRVEVQCSAPTVSRAPRVAGPRSVNKITMPSFDRLSIYRRLVSRDLDRAMCGSGGMIGLWPWSRMQISQSRQDIGTPRTHTKESRSGGRGRQAGYHSREPNAIRG